MSNIDEREDEAQLPIMDKKEGGKKEEVIKYPNSKYFPQFEKNLSLQEDKIVVITGTTSGTGNIAAKIALQKKAKIILLNRKEKSARDSLKELFEEYPELEANTSFVVCDLQDFASVKKAADAVKELVGDKGIDVLCNNAGIMAFPDEATKDGYDIQMQTNHLGHFMLTKELYPLLELAAKEKGEARVVNHSSFMRLAGGPLRAKYFQQRGGNLGGHGGRWPRYQQTKLANSVFTSELQKRLTKVKSNIAVYCAHPGISSTNLMQSTQKQGGLANLNVLKGAQSAEDGTMGLLKCMFAPKQNLKKGGLYGPRFTKGKATRRYHGPMNTSAAGRLLWRESERACGEFRI